MEIAGKFHPGFEEINKIYQKFRKNVSVGFSEMNEIYEKSFGNYANEKSKNNGLDMNELFDKMSVKFKAPDGSPLIGLSVINGRMNKTLPGQFQIDYYKTFMYYTYKGEPLETIIIRQNSFDFEDKTLIKCLTFFSHIQEEWKNLTAQIEMIDIRMSGNLVFK